MALQQQPNPLKILLAEDDRDDRFFFDKALKSLPIHTSLETEQDGEKLIDHLIKNYAELPDVLFLDVNLPRKNGFECLAEIKNNPKLATLPVIIYSTSIHSDVADELYISGAHYYLPKRDLMELIEILSYVLNMMIATKFTRPARAQFTPVFNKV